MAIKFDTYASTGAGGGAVDSVNGDTGAVVVTLDGVTDQGASTTNAITVGGVTIGTEYSLPTADGANGQALTTNGTGTLSFTTITSDVTSVNTQTGPVVLSADDLLADHTASNYTAANNNIDGHLSGIDTKLGTFASGLTYKGSFNATAGTPSLLNAEQGDLYIIDTAGTIYGQTWAIGDHLLINADMGGTITNSKIDKVDNTDAITSVNGITSGAVVLSADDLAADHTASNYTPANSNIDGHLSGIDSKLSAQLEAGDNISTLTNDSGFISDITGESINDLSDVTITAAANGEVLSYNGSAWVNAAASGGASALDDLTDVTITAATTGEVLKYNGSAWVDASVAYSEVTGTPSLATVATTGAYSDLSGSPTNVSTFTNDSGYLTDITGESIDDLSDVTITTATNGQVLSYNGSAWVNSAASAGSLAGLSDTTISTPATGEVLKYNGSAWVDAVLAYSELSGTPTNVSTFTNDSGYLTDITGESIGDLSDVTITAAATGEVLKYNGSAWVDASVAYSEVTGTPTNVSTFTNDAGYLTDITGESIDDLSDVTITTPTNGQVLSYNGSAWVNSASAGGASALDDLTDVTITAAATGEVLRYNGSAWVDAVLAYSDLSGTPTNVSTFTNDSGYLTAITGESIDDLSDVTITTPTNGQVLSYNGSAWVNAAASGGGGGYTYSAITTTTSAQAGYHYSCTGTLTLNLPTGSTAGEEIRVKNMGSGTITIDPNSTETVDGQPTYTLDVQYSAITLVATGNTPAAWEII